MPKNRNTEQPRPNLPAGISREFLLLRAKLLNEGTLRAGRISELLASDQARQLVERALSDMAGLDSYFQPSGPGGFWRSQVLKHTDGSRIKLHLFPDLASCGGDTGPHSHSTVVTSAVHAGAIANKDYSFIKGDGDWQEEAFAAPAHVNRTTTIKAYGQLVLHGSDIYKPGEVYSVAHGDIHTSEPAKALAALTLCYFGPLITPGARYNMTDMTPAEGIAASEMLRPAEVVERL